MARTRHGPTVRAAMAAKWTADKEVAMNVALRQPTPASPRPTVIRYRLRYPPQVPFAATRPVAMTQIVEISKMERSVT
jgi:hypothetical protein